MSLSGPPCEVANAGMRVPALPAVIQVRQNSSLVGVFEIVQIRHHGGAVFGLVADGADGVEKLLAVFAFAGLCVAAGAIALENGLPVGLGNRHAGVRWASVRVGITGGRMLMRNIQVFGALVRGDIDRFEQRAALPADSRSR